MTCIRFGLVALSLALALQVRSSRAMYTATSVNDTSGDAGCDDDLLARAYYRGAYDDKDGLVTGYRRQGIAFDNETSLLLSRDVWSPKITNPSSKTVWVAGTTTTVTWDTSDAPEDITNTEGKVLLGHMEDGTDENLDVDNPLAEGFDIRDGQVKVKVPYVSPGNDYIVVVMGDSGNKSPTFTIN